MRTDSAVETSAGGGGPTGPTALLEVVRTARVEADRLEVEIARAAFAWCQAHRPSLLADTLERVPGGEEPITLGGVGTPQVMEFCVAEFAAAAGMSTPAGRSLLGDVLELAYRLPRLWAAVLAGRVPVWRARQVPDFTICLSEQAVARVDVHLAAGGHRVLGRRAVERIAQTVMARTDPEQAEARRAAQAERRGVLIDLDAVDIDGLVPVSAVLDAPDALDLDRALNTIATRLREMGCTEPRQVRRAMALGELSRVQPTLDLTSDCDGDRGQAGDCGGPVWTGVPATRRVVLYVHVSEGAFDEGGVGRCENTRSPVLTEAVRAWCGPGASISVRPVIDVDEPRSVESYEIPARIAEQVILRDGTCTFPYCNRPARGSDLDHMVPWGSVAGVGSNGGDTCTDNLAALCRHHHRLKTFAGWSYTRLDGTAYLWRSPHGLAFVRDSQGTRMVEADPSRSGPPRLALTQLGEVH